MLFLSGLVADGSCCRAKLRSFFWREHFFFSRRPLNLDQALASRAGESRGFALDVVPADAVKAIHRFLLHSAAKDEGRLRGGPFLCFPIEHFHGFDHYLRHRPLNLNRPTVRFNGPFILAIGEFAFDEDVSTGLDLGTNISRARISNTRVPLSLFLPLIMGVFIALRRGNRKPGDVLTARRCAGLRVAASKADESYSVQIHRVCLFLSGMEFGLRNAIPALAASNGEPSISKACERSFSAEEERSDGRGYYPKPKAQGLVRGRDGVP